MARKDKGAPVLEAPERLPEPRLKKVYRETVLPALMEEFKYSSVMQAPRMVKLVVNMGTGSDDKELEKAIRDMQAITGQKPIARAARLSVSNFKIREGMKVGCKVTLRGDRMLHFFDKLCTVALPKLRDFQGLNPKSFDGRGNYSMGLKEQLIFPEIDYESFDKLRGMDITIATTATSDQEGRRLLKLMGLPLREK
jgi:large subunit ribosomal protein L5